MNSTLTISYSTLSPESTCPSHSHRQGRPTGCLLTDNPGQHQLELSSISNYTRSTGLALNSIHLLLSLLPITFADLADEDGLAPAVPPGGARHIVARHHVAYCLVAARVERVIADVPELVHAVEGVPDGALFSTSVSHQLHEHSFTSRAMLVIER